MSGEVDDMGLIVGPEWSTDGVTIDDAARRATVVTPEGIEGTLIAVRPRSNRARVVIGGRHYWFPAEALFIVENAAPDGLLR